MGSWRDLILAWLYVQAGQVANFPGQVTRFAVELLALGVEPEPLGSIRHNLKEMQCEREIGISKGWVSPER